MSGIKVFAPASVANLACGYDVLGLCIDNPGDEIIAKKSQTPGVEIVKITGDKGKLPRDIHKNTAGYAAQQVYKAAGVTNFGVSLEIHKKMPIGSGLGSSAASAAAAVVATNEILGRPFHKMDLLKFAVMGEQKADGAFHADNVAPALLGGIILIRDNTTLDIIQLPVPNGLKVLVVHPEVEILTREARSVIKNTVPLEDHIKQNGNIAALMMGLVKSDFDLIKRSMVDHIIEQQRAYLIPQFYAVKEAAYGQGALACSISGAGPSIFSLYNNSIKAESAAEKIQQIYQNAGIRTHVYLSDVNIAGTTVF